MKTLMTRRSIVIISVAVLIAISTIVSINVFSTVGPVTGLAHTVSRPLRAFASMTTRTFESIYDSIYRYDDLMERYEMRARQVVELEAMHRDIMEIAEENERLRSMLNFGERQPEYDWVDAFVSGRSASNWSSSFSIDIGYSNSPIVRGNAVVTEYGVLIGQVSEVGASTSTVVTILDTTFSAGALIGDGDGRGTLKGDFTYMRSGILILDHLTADFIVRPGDSVVTSGYGGVFPRGLVVGDVAEVLRHSTGIGMYATVTPMRDVETIQHVFIITGFETTDRE
jgi:rod shape-determining protein MreC